MTATLLAIDPGAKYCGAALYVDGKLYAAAYLAPKPGTARSVAVTLEAWLYRVAQSRADLVTSTGKVGRLVVESQQVYAGPSRGNPNDLIAVAQTAGAIMARIEAYEHQLVLPRVWTGGIPKEIRLRRFLQTLDADETAVITSLKLPQSKLKDTADAAALGKWALGKLPTEPESGWKQ